MERRFARSEIGRSYITRRSRRDQAVEVYPPLKTEVRTFEQRRTLQRLEEAEILGQFEPDEQLRPTAKQRR